MFSLWQLHGISTPKGSFHNGLAHEHATTIYTALCSVFYGGRQGEPTGLGDEKAVKNRRTVQRNRRLFMYKIWNSRNFVSSTLMFSCKKVSWMATAYRVGGWPTPSPLAKHRRNQLKRKSDFSNKTLNHFAPSFRPRRNGSCTAAHINSLLDTVFHAGNWQALLSNARG